MEILSQIRLHLSLACNAVTNTQAFVRSTEISLGVKGALYGLPQAAGNIATTTGNNLAAYPGMAGASADALETGALLANTAAFSYGALGVALSAAVPFATAADVYAWLACWDVQ